MGKRVAYLCGGINGLTDAQCNNWRDYVIEKYSGPTLNPMRRDYRGKEDESVDEIVEGDYADIDNSDVILANATQPSWGTAMEIHYAYQKGITVYIVVSPNTKISPWLKYHSHKIFTSLDEALALIEYTNKADAWENLGETITSW